MVCDIVQYLPKDDSPDEEIERLVHSTLLVVGNADNRQRRLRRRRLRPREFLELQVESDLRDDPLILRAYRQRNGLYAELHYQSLKIRALHTHDGHRNPGDRFRLPNGHMHFPTVEFPLIANHSSYAYEVDCSTDVSLVEFIGLFCDLLNIRLGWFQATLDSVGRS